MLYLVDNVLYLKFELVKHCVLSLRFTSRGKTILIAKVKKLVKKNKWNEFYLNERFVLPELFVDRSVSRNEYRRDEACKYANERIVFIAFHMERFYST